jgi:ferrous iron transport protein B
MTLTPPASHKTETLRVALAGNPNAGKSTLFNALTGLRQHVGNWPGKTVEKRSGVFSSGDLVLEITDLPGTYSLSAYSLEEIIARDFILDEQPDAIVVVVDATNLERNLYLVVQLLEYQTPVLVVLNMMDVAARQGLSFHISELHQSLGAPVVQASARSGEGLNTIVETIAQLVGGSSEPFALDYGAEIESEITFLMHAIQSSPENSFHFPRRWLAIKLLEADEDVAARIRAMTGGLALLTTADLVRARLEALFQEEVDTIIADRRYRWAHDLVARSVKPDRDETASTSDRIDRVVTHRWLGIPIFLLAMWLVFKLTVDFSAPWVVWLDQVIAGPVSRWAVTILTALGMGDSWVESLIVDGVLGGVGAVLAFIPVLLALYFALAVLEDSGYMARGAFVMDRLMNRIGLQGRSFLPLVVGFGCSVPAIYATRTLTNQRDRILTGLLVPFMSCGARLPVYVLFAAIFFPQFASLVILGLYLLGIVVALVVGLILQRTILPRTASPGLVMELPPYRLPHLRSLWYHMWQRTRSFLSHAATLILFMSLVIWLLMAVPMGGKGEFADVAVEDSAFGRLSSAVVPALKPLGFGTWQAGGALISGLVAKEVVVSTFAQSFSMVERPSANEIETSLIGDLAGIFASFGSAAVDTIRALPSLVGIDLSSGEPAPEPSSLSAAIQISFGVSSGGHAALAGLAFMVFVLLYTPCMAAIAAERQELGARWMWLSLGGQLALAWLLAFAVFQGGRLLGVG